MATTLDIANLVTCKVCGGLYLKPDAAKHKDWHAGVDGRVELIAQELTDRERALSLLNING